MAVVEDAADVDRLRQLLPKTGIPNCMSGAEARVQVSVAPEIDTVMSSIVGVAGLEATYRSHSPRQTDRTRQQRGLVSGGQLVMEAVRQYGSELIPVDSEHNGAHQCLRAGLAIRGEEIDSDRFGWSVSDYPQGKFGPRVTMQTL